VPPARVTVIPSMGRTPPNRTVRPSTSITATPPVASPGR
jgi:hypothetical protein